MDASLPSHPDVPTYRYPPAGLHPGTSAHMHGEAPIRPSMDMGPRIKGSVPSPHYRHTDKYTRKDGHMCGHIGKRGRSHRGKRGNRHMGARTVLWIGVCMWSHVCTRGSTPSPVPLEKETLPPCIVGWVGGKNGGPVCEKGGGPWREGKNPPGLPGHHQGKAKRYGAHMDASGRGDGILPVRHSPVALRYLKSLFRGIVEYLGAPGCTHTTTNPPVCTCGSPCLQATGYRPVPSCVSMHLSWQLETRNSQKEIPLRCARGNYDAHARQPPSRTRGFLCPYHGSSSLGFPIHFGLCHLSQWAMYLVIALPGVSGRL